MIGQVKGLAALRGYRNLPHGDVEALARAVSAFSRLALSRGSRSRRPRSIRSSSRRDGVVAVDALLVLKG